MKDLLFSYLKKRRSFCTKEYLRDLLTYNIAPVMDMTMM